MEQNFVEISKWTKRKIADRMKTENERYIVIQSDAKLQFFFEYGYVPLLPQCFFY